MTDQILILVDIAHGDSAVDLLIQSRKSFADGTHHVAYVMPFGFYSYVEPYVSDDSQRAAADRAKSELAAILDRAGMGQGAVPHILRGGIGEQALQLAKKLDAAWIVLNATRSDSTHTTLGTHAAQIARHATCSVCLVRHKA
ncbi:universal stress protein [Rhodophyticola sp. CCM32]|uniref:universal stress protein n=1 Tax=Rhodophyticola sp. CCM32 TaxID=2916397 RepID=UPI00143DDFE6|nr:universal stress protein [Rhodophyticola sp. CCM32]